MVYINDYKYLDYWETLTNKRKHVPKEIYSPSKKSKN
jgi:hypothetical protein